MEDLSKKLSPSELDDFAAVSAISALEEVRDQTTGDIADDPELAVDVAEFEATVALLAYAAPPVTMATDLKQRLMARIEADDSASEDVSELLDLLSISIAKLKQKSTELIWEDMAIASGFQMATWQVDQTKREQAFFVRAETAVKFPSHTHATGEVILVLDGDVVVGDQTYLEGDRITSEAGSIHGPETRTGCLLLCISSLDDCIL